MSLTSTPSKRSRIDRAKNNSSQPNQHESNLFGIIEGVLQAADPSTAACIIASSLPPDIKPCTLAVGIANSDGTCRLLAVTGRNQLDHRSERVHAIESALDESLLNRKPIAYSRHRSQDHPAKTHEQLAQLTGSEWIQSRAFMDSNENAIGAWLIWGDGDSQQESANEWLESCQQPLGNALKAICEARQGVLERLKSQLRLAFQRSDRRRSWMAIATALVLLLAMPIPHKISCGCVLEPVIRRYISAPFDAILSKTLVEPGDFVHVDQPLVQLEHREIEWELASLQAAHDKAQKSRDSAMAVRDAVSAQLARLEMEQIEHQLALFEHRLDNLRIDSPFDGVVISGDLDRVEGAPVTVGQTLLEVAPLDTVVVEVEIPEGSVSYIKEGVSTTTVKLDAFPSQTWHGKLAKIHPRAEIRDDEQVFVAEIELDNSDHILRPGMRGRAKVNTGWAPAGWVFFHRSYYELALWLGW